MLPKTYLLSIDSSKHFKSSLCHTRSNTHTESVVKCRVCVCVLFKYTKKQKILNSYHMFADNVHKYSYVRVKFDRVVLFQLQLFVVYENLDCVSFLFILKELHYTTLYCFLFFILLLLHNTNTHTHETHKQNPKRYKVRYIFCLVKQSCFSSVLSL